MTLGELGVRLRALGARVVGDPELIRVSSVFQDSRQVVPGALFAARAGSKHAGLGFWQAAEARGAVALLRAHDTALAADVPGLEVSDVPRALGLAAEAVYGDPSRTLDLVGITGTNGKTTTAWLTALALNATGARAGRLGTLGFAFLDHEDPGGLTTPAADEISRRAREIVVGGGTHLVMEVSSHALTQARVDALSFAVAAFSNLTQDHLDYHRDMEAYGQAKRRLFEELDPRCRVINIDDPFGLSLAQQNRALTVSSRSPADVCAEDVRLTGSGIQARLRIHGKSLPFASRLVGWHNLDNALLSLGILEALGLALEPALEALERTHGVPGRFERCDSEGDDIAVLVDYAHTPGALERVLLAARELPHQNLCCVFGCGGDRDASKRPQMGAVVGRLATSSIVTNDNPRTEQPERIAEAISVGLEREGAAYEVIFDRRSAIDRAILGANPGDVVVIAGKGHEPYQIVGERVLPFDDRDEARRALALRRRLEA
jgi:UDP-N-acetylmuramoyl-L-alanyl-D-glutamate--2,6-diaminopimelate ligase